MSAFASLSPFKKIMVISSKGSAKVADRSPFKMHRELKLILGDETIEVTKLGSGDLMVELKSNNQAKKLGAIATFGHPCDCRSSQEPEQFQGNYSQS
ncbi:hypothetical protein PoB_005223500 [Plakobranchus ocellatus]|uniref:Uncharacterized protein n=1 Tax=Plakobranchus ocellatus TaxID=259542 RepID=A0AAV4C283_9GAST|nr:hypothetical protein PoB_005223500 [Plakobranchus ocellatus]